MLDEYQSAIIALLDILLSISFRAKCVSLLIKHYFTSSAFSPLGVIFSMIVPINMTSLALVLHDIADTAELIFPVCYGFKMPMIEATGISA